jgi:hypothetical protein
MGALFKALAKAEDPLGFPRKGRLYPHAVAKPFIQSLGLALTLCAKRRGDHRGKTGSCRDLWIETRFSAMVRPLGLHRTVEASGSTRRLLGYGLDALAPCARMGGQGGGKSEGRSGVLKGKGGRFWGCLPSPIRYQG